MTRLIDADALLEYFREFGHFSSDDYIVETITNAPTIHREGWVSVPIEPTEVMLEAVLNGTPYADDNKQLMREAYKAMLAAAPTETE